MIFNKACEKKLNTERDRAKFQIESECKSPVTEEWDEVDKMKIVHIVRAYQRHWSNYSLLSRVNKIVDFSAHSVIASRRRHFVNASPSPCCFFPTHINRLLCATRQICHTMSIIDIFLDHKKIKLFGLLKASGHVRRESHHLPIMPTWLRRDLCFFNPHHRRPLSNNK